MNLLITCLQIGIILGIMSLGVNISFNILNAPDLTVDASFTLGAAVTIMFSIINLPFLGLIFGTLSGALAGLVTGLLHTKLKIQVVLAGILTMTSLYSVNYWITNKRPSLDLYSEGKTIFSMFYDFKTISFLDTSLREVLILGLLIIIMVIVIILLTLFFKTNLGLAIRATGDNEKMLRASSINTSLTKNITFSLANAIVAFAGGLFVQYQRSYDSTTGTGMMVVGLASIIIGEAIFRKRKKLSATFIVIILGAIIYRLMYSSSLLLEFVDPIDIKIVTSLIIIVSLVFSNVKRNNKKQERKIC